MKQVIITLVIGLLLPVALKAQNREHSAEQLELRTELFNFLKVEGFMPEIDSDDDIKFKSEGQTLFIRVSKNDDSPMFVSFFQEFGYPEEYSRETFLVATRELNFYKGVKVLCFDNAFRITAEMFVRNAEAVKTVFYRLREIIEDLRSDVLDECKKASLISSTNSSTLALLTANSS